jgi:adenosine deaminase
MTRNRCDQSIGGSLRALPKAHLHLHLDGAMRRSTFSELAARAGTVAPLPTGYGSFADFSETITAAAGLLTTAVDAVRVVDEVVEDAATAGACWIEPSMWPGLFRGRLGRDEEVIETVLAAGQAAAARNGLGFGLVVAANRDQGPDEALRLAKVAVRFAGQGVIGFGLDGDELAAPPELFVEAFKVIRDAGLLSVPHAGEHGPPENVRTAVRLLGADRIMHGVRAVQDSTILEQLASRGTALDVCPTSNVMLSVTDSLSTHPMPSLLRAGVRCSLGADDPLLFDTDLLAEYTIAREQLGLTDDQLADVATASIDASAAPRELVQAALTRVADWRARAGGC